MLWALAPQAMYGGVTMNETIDREYAAAVFNRQRAAFMGSMQQLHALQREIDLLVGKVSSDPQVRRKVTEIKGELEHSAAERDVSLQQIRKAERAFSRLEADFSRRFAEPAPATEPPAVMKKAPVKKPRVFV